MKLFRFTFQNNLFWMCLSNSPINLHFMFEYYFTYQKLRFSHRTSYQTHGWYLFNLFSLNSISFCFFSVLLLQFCSCWHFLFTALNGLGPDLFIFVPCSLFPCQTIIRYLCQLMLLTSDWKLLPENGTYLLLMGQN